jgi:hypothetical protein
MRSPKLLDPSTAMIPPWPGSHPVLFLSFWELLLGQLEKL